MSSLIDDPSRLGFSTEDKWLLGMIDVADLSIFYASALRASEPVSFEADFFVGSRTRLLV